MGGDGKGSGKTIWYGLGGRQPLITKTPMEMSMEAAAKRAGTKPAKRLSAKQALAMRKAEAAIRDSMPAIGPSDYDHYLRFGG